MSWNYRVVRHRNKLNPEYVEKMRKKYPEHPDYSEVLSIHEVFYKDGAPKVPTAEHVEAWVREAATPVEEGIVLLKSTLDLMGECFDQPILDAWDLPGKYVVQDELE